MARALFAYKETVCPDCRRLIAKGEPFRWHRKIRQGKEKFLPGCVDPCETRLKVEWAWDMLIRQAEIDNETYDTLIEILHKRGLPDSEFIEWFQTTVDEKHGPFESFYREANEILFAHGTTSSAI